VITARLKRKRRKENLLPKRREGVRTEGLLIGEAGVGVEITIRERQTREKILGKVSVMMEGVTEAILEKEE